MYSEAFEKPTCRILALVLPVDVCKHWKCTASLFAQASNIISVSGL